MMQKDLFIYLLSVFSGWDFMDVTGHITMSILKI